MQSLVALVLVLCSVNVGGLMMSKAYARQHEFAVRTAMGAAWRRLLRQSLTEGFVIAAAGTLIGTAAGWSGTSLLLHFFRDPMMMEPPSVKPDPAIFLVSLAFLILATSPAGSAASRIVTRIGSVRGAGVTKPDPCPHGAHWF